MSNREKYKQIKKEAKACLWSLIAIIVFWAISGFGISRLDIVVYHTPLWIITGCVGTWIFSVVLVALVVKIVFKDFSLDENMGNQKTSEVNMDKEVI